MNNLYTRKLIRPLFYLTTLIGAGQVSAQSYYPGGLGNSNLILWLNAKKTSSITKNGSNQVATWADLSGNGYNFTQATTASKPVYSATGGPNSLPALTFNATNSQYMSLSSLPSTISFTGGISFFTQASFSTPSTWGWQRIIDFGNGQANNNICYGRYGATANTYFEGWNNTGGAQTYTTTANLVDGTSTIYEALMHAGAAASTTTVNQFYAGATQAASGQYGSSLTWVPRAVTRSSNYIGRSNWSADDYFTGTMSEVLLYNTFFNTTQHVIMENYLSAEWGKAVSVQKFTTPTSTTYGTNLVGIGYTSSTDYFTTNPAGSTDGLGFSSGTGATDFLKTSGYLMGAHNGQSNTVLTNVNATIAPVTSASPISMWNRSWYVQKSGGNSTGNVTLNFNFPDYNGGSVLSSYTYALLYNATDGTFSNRLSTLVTLVSVPTANTATDIVSFVVNAANLANGYYTIIYSTSVLPFSISGFAATKQENGVLLNWSAGNEANVDHYEIQRGASSTGFFTVGTVAAGASQYSFTDDAPAAGRNYYRLKIVGKDGSSTYSTIVLMDFQESLTAVPTVYPNPAVDQLHIGLANATDDASIVVLNTAGQTLKTVKATGAGRVDIAIGDLNKGIYFVEISTGGAKYVKKIMKQ
jgi:hypothetical protein